MTVVTVDVLRGPVAVTSLSRLLFCVFANKKSAAIITFVSLNVMYIFFPMAVFEISSLLLILSHLVMM